MECYGNPFIPCWQKNERTFTSPKIKTLHFQYNTVRRLTYYKQSCCKDIQICNIAVWLPGAPPKNKKIRPPKKFLTYQEMKLSNSKIKKFLIFSQKRSLHFSARARKNKKIHPEKKILIFQETETLKKLLVFWEMEPFTSSSKKQNKSFPKKILCISGNGTFWLSD